MSKGPPSGFALHTRVSPATRGWLPIYASSQNGAFRLGMFITEAHSNSRGTLHGGVIATLIDNACGLTLGLALSGATDSIVTTSLNVDYISPAKVGQWFEVTPRVVKVGKHSGIVDALVTADGDIIARANASFRLLG